MSVSVKEAQVTILVEINGQVHLTAMEKEKLEAVAFLAKNSIHGVIPTGKSQAELNEFLGYRDE
ncbi:hypothetical protein [Shouchella clausii]|uniref:hypothetical protein n=1 Tax=Shouchella clausii TaxID=79880 RepID=UPI001C72C3C7|nr:hypothetical protein [Shouchella clausii]MBX0320117.1 hypothetical protein [Shouchella clausii]